jgi:hypothetical protein
MRQLFREAASEYLVFHLGNKIVNRCQLGLLSKALPAIVLYTIDFSPKLSDNLPGERLR